VLIEGVSSAINTPHSVRIRNSRLREMQLNGACCRHIPRSKVEIVRRGVRDAGGTYHVIKKQSRDRKFALPKSRHSNAHLGMSSWLR